jgi:hypothetical protein
LNLLRICMSTRDSEEFNQDINTPKDLNFYPPGHVLEMQGCCQPEESSDQR